MIAMLTQAQALETLRELAEGIDRLKSHFEQQTVEPAAEPAAAHVEPEATAIVEATTREENAATLETKNERLRQVEAEIAQAELKRTELDAALAAIQTRLQSSSGQLEKEEARLSRLNEQREKAEAMIEAASLHEQTAVELDRRREELDLKAADIARWSAASDAANHLKEKLWPGWLRAGSLAVWKEKLEAAISSGTATPAAALLFSALHGYTAATKDTDLKLLHDSLREVSRRLFPWLKENGLHEIAAVETAGQWAAVINQECQGRAEVEIPEPGAPATNQWMIFRPRPGVNSPDVASVQTWCVRNAQKQPIHRAEVTV